VQNYNVTVADNHGGTTIEQVSVTLTGTNDAPVANAIAVSMTNHDAPVTVVASYTDPDLIDFHTDTIGTIGTIGLVTNNGNETFTYNQNGKFAGLANGATATDHFTYTVADNHGATSTQTVTVTIHGAAVVAPPPPANPDHLVNDNWMVTHGEIAGFTTQAVLANDTGSVGGALTVVSVAGPDVSFDPVSGFITYTAPGIGINTDSFSYTTTDTLGHLSTATVNVTLTNAASTLVGSATSQAEWLNATGSASPTTLIGGAGADRLIGGSGSDQITGGPGADIITGGPTSGGDHFIYNFGGVATPNIDSSLAAMDTITDFHRVGAAIHGVRTVPDIIELNGFNFAPASIAAVTDTAIALPFTSASVVGYFADGNAVHVESDAAVTARSAQIYVDANHNGNFDAGQDLVIHVDGMKAAFTVGDFQFH
jgi:VCBS repeat-containing protein